MTAIRDLKELDQQRLLRRVHGRALANMGCSYESLFQTRSIKNQAAKKVIDLKIAELDNGGDTVALDVGTITLENVPRTKGKRYISTITSCLQIAAKNVEQVSFKVDTHMIVGGGIVHPRDRSTVGPVPEQLYHDMRVDRTFIGSGRICLEDG